MKLAAILRSHLLVALLIVLGLGLWTLRPFLLDPYQQIDDIRNLHAVHQLLDPELFPHRLTDSLTFAETSAAYFMVLAFLSRLVTPLLAGKVLGLLLLLIGAAYTYRLVSLLARPPTALIATIGFAVFNLAAESEISAIGGLQRSFFTPLLLALLYYLHRGRFLAAATVVLFSGLFYAPSLPVVALTYALTAVRQRPAPQASMAGRWRPMLFLLFALVIVFGMQFQLVLDRLGTIQEATLEPQASSIHILQDPTYTAGGRRQLFIIFPIVGRGGFVSNVPAAFQLTLLGIFALLARRLLGEQARPLPRAALHLFWASLAVYLLSWLAIIGLSSFVLYIPSRHTQASFFVLLLLYTMLNVRATVRALAEYASGARPLPPVLILLLPLVLVGIVVVMPLLQTDLVESTPWLRTARWLLLSLSVVLLVLLTLVVRRRRDSTRRQSPRQGRRFGLVAAAVLLPMAFLYVEVFRPIAYSPSAEKRALLAFLGTLPKDVLLAGDPCTLNDAPFYARRSVAFNCEIYQGDTLIVDTLRAYYATDPAALVSYCRQYRVDYLVTDSMTLTADAIAAGSYFFRPYTDMLAEELAGREAFYLAEPAAQDLVFESGPYRVVACHGGEP